MGIPEFGILADEAIEFFNGIKNKNFMQHELSIEKKLHPDGEWMMFLTITSSYPETGYTSPCCFYVPQEKWSDKEALFRGIEYCIDWATEMK